MNEGWGPTASRSSAADAVAALTPPRRRVLDLLDEDPKSVVDIATELGLHANTAREHLDGLVASGLALRTRLRPTGRGRPGWGYTLRPGARSPSVGEYATLAEVLAEHVISQGGDVAADMERLGRGWGTRLMEGHDDVESPHEAVVDLLGALGFDPEERSSAIRLRQCPMLDVARRHPEVVCQVHLGLVEGALTSVGGDTEAVSLEAFAERGACILRLP